MKLTGILKIVFGVFASGLVFFGVILGSPFFGVYLVDRSADVNYLSVATGQPHQLQCDEEAVRWRSDNPAISVDDKGVVLAQEALFYPDSQSQITGASIADGSVVCRYQVTVVPWVANHSSIEILDIMPAWTVFGVTFYPPHSFKKTEVVSNFVQSFIPPIRILATEGKKLYFAEGRSLYETDDSFASRRRIAELPSRPGRGRMLVTPFGYFWRGGQCIYRSTDLSVWVCSHQTQHQPWLMDEMDFWFDAESQVGYVYVSEYSSKGTGAEHKLYRGLFRVGEMPEWTTIFTLFSQDEQVRDPGKFLIAGRHIHVVKVDPYTGAVWLGTGDADEDSMIMYSDDHGTTFRRLGFGSQAYRTLAFWFTAGHVYWNMDTGAPPQKIFRVARSDLANRGTLTPVLGEGVTKPGVAYYVVASDSADRFPVSVGQRYEEAEKRHLDALHKVLAVDDEQYDFRTAVADLTNGSHWSVLPAVTATGEDLFLMSHTSEGFADFGTRDGRARIFGIRERQDGEVDVQELLNAGTWREGYERARLDPVVQDADGYVYFVGVGTRHGDSVYKTRLTWRDFQEGD